MSDRPDIRVVPADATRYPTLLQLQVHEPQRDFVGPVAVSLADAMLCADSEAMAILRNDEPIGFYRIEKKPRSIADMDFDEPTLGLRSLFIDARWQGQGLGTLALAAVMRDLAQRHPGARNLVLTVNVRNTSALALYRRAGFRETGGLYHGGRSGPQHVMLGALPL